MPHSDEKCPGKLIKCDDPTCKQFYKKHWMCEIHKLHVGDKIRDVENGHTGYVYDANPFGSKRSAFVMWDNVQIDPNDGKANSGKLFMGHHACVHLQKTGGRTNNITSGY